MARKRAVSGPAAKKLKALRAAGLSQEKAAAELGVDRQAVRTAAGPKGPTTSTTAADLKILETQVRKLQKLLKDPHLSASSFATLNAELRKTLTDLAKRRVLLRTDTADDDQTMAARDRVMAKLAAMAAAPAPAPPEPAAQAEPTAKIG